MALDRAKLANIDRRLLADLDREADWQLVKVPASSATWSTWKRYCDVVGLSMGRAIAALIDLELPSVVDDDVDAQAAVIAERHRELDLRAQALAGRERELQLWENRLRVRRRPTKAELERMAEQIELGAALDACSAIIVLLHDSTEFRPGFAHVGSSLPTVAAYDVMSETLSHLGWRIPSSVPIACLRRGDGHLAA